MPDGTVCPCAAGSSAERERGVRREQHKLAVADIQVVNVRVDAG
jgi:hypothetical protein